MADFGIWYVSRGGAMQHFFTGQTYECDACGQFEDRRHRIYVNDADGYRYWEEGSFCATCAQKLAAERNAKERERRQNRFGRLA